MSVVTAQFKIYLSIITPFLVRYDSFFGDFKPVCIAPILHKNIYMKVQSVVLTLVFLIFIQESSDAQQTRSVSKIKLSTGVTLEVAESGDPDGKPVIFLHGFTDSRHSFDYVVPNLPTGIRAMVITQRGHGNSDKPQFGYTPDDFAADLQAFMAARNLT